MIYQTERQMVQLALAIARRVVQHRLDICHRRHELRERVVLERAHRARIARLCPRPRRGRTIGKLARFVGRAAHAGGAPHLGVNALYAAQIALAGINALRETFRDEDTIRVHPILTHGGSQVNVIPAEARLETYVRGRTLDAVVDANAKVDRALRADALALGATVEIVASSWIDMLAGLSR